VVEASASALTGKTLFTTGGRPKPDAEKHIVIGTRSLLNLRKEIARFQLCKRHLMAFGAILIEQRGKITRYKLSLENRFPWGDNDGRSRFGWAYG